MWRLIFTVFLSVSMFCQGEFKGPYFQEPITEKLKTIVPRFRAKGSINEIIERIKIKLLKHKQVVNIVYIPEH